MNNTVVCFGCGQKANYVFTNGYTVLACSNCCEASVLETNVIIKIDPVKLLGQPLVQREFLMIALTAKALYDNWDIIIKTYVPMGE